MSQFFSPFGKPLYVMPKAVSSICNLACKYCYYLEKNNLYKTDNPTDRFTMSDEILEKFTEQYILSQSQQEIMFTWHGGEPLMRHISFYKKALELQKRYGYGYVINNSIQTNGTLITDEWCKFFKENNFLVGVSIDGPQEFHDEYRKNKSGMPSFRKVMQGINLLNKYGVEWNAMAVVNDFNADYPLDFYNFFKEINCKFIQFTPAVERITNHSDGRYLANICDEKDSHLADFSVSPKQWGDFLCAIFDEWVKNDVGDTYVQIFDSTLANWLGEKPGVCTMAETCGHAGVMEYNGDVYTCDHFVFPEYKLGNIRNKTLTEMMYSEKEINFGNEKKSKLPSQCKSCKYLFACNGECPKNRFIKTQDGENGLNYLCEGYYKFFNHVAPYMEFMKNELLAKRAPANIMEALRNKTF